MIPATCMLEMGHGIRHGTRFCFQISWDSIWPRHNIMVSARGRSTTIGADDKQAWAIASGIYPDTNLSFKLMELSQLSSFSFWYQLRSP